MSLTSPPPSPLAASQQPQPEGSPAKKRKKNKKAQPAARPARESQGPSTFKEVEALSPERQVGVWPSNVKQDAATITQRSKGQDHVYSVPKLRAVLGDQACLPTHIADISKLKHVRCLSPGQPGHEANGSAHKINAQFNAKWNHPNTGEAYRKTFKV